jgi:hypothetical protein
MSWNEMVQYSTHVLTSSTRIKTALSNRSYGKDGACDAIACHGRERHIRPSLRYQQSCTSIKAETSKDVEMACVDFANLLMPTPVYLGR